MKFNEKIQANFLKLGNNIKTLRENKKISISELSKITGINKLYLQKIENGLAYGISIERHLLKIANALNIKFIDFFNFD